MSELQAVVISDDLKIVGQNVKIISKSRLQVDGNVIGDVVGAEITIGKQGNVTGTIAAERVTVHGRLSGVIRGAVVTLEASAHVKGDIHHHTSLTIEEGAEFDGRCHRPSDAGERDPVLANSGNDRASGLAH